MRNRLGPRRHGERMLGGSASSVATKGTWYRAHPGAAVAVAVGLFVLVTVLHWFHDSSGQAITVLYVLPIALLAVTFGLRGGLVGAGCGFGLFALLGILHSSGDSDADGGAG